VPCDEHDAEDDPEPEERLISRGDQQQQLALTQMPIA
jgi:hypothetical protein